MNRRGGGGTRVCVRVQGGGSKYFFKERKNHQSAATPNGGKITAGVPVGNCTLYPSPEAGLIASNDVKMLLPDKDV